MRTITIYDLVQIASRLNFIEDIVAISCDINNTITLKLMTEEMSYELGTITIKQAFSVEVTKLLENHQAEIQLITNEYFESLG